MNCPHCGKPLAIVKADTAAPPKPAAQSSQSLTPDHWESVRSTVTCNRCGAEELAWLKGRNGKPYLAIARRLSDGRLGADRREFHQCSARSRTAAQPNIHGVAIDDSDIPF